MTLKPEKPRTTLGKGVIKQDNVKYNTGLVFFLYIYNREEKNKWKKNKKN